MPDDDTGLDWLDELAGDDAEAALRAAMDHAPVLLGTPGVVPALLLDPRWDPERRMRLFEALLEHARLDRESGGRLGERFLAEARGTIDGLAASGGLDLETALSLARAYARAEIDAPEALASFLLASIADEAKSRGCPGDLDAELDGLRQEAEGDTYRLHAMLEDLLGLLPAPLRPGFVHRVAGRDETWCGRLALYWLLDTASEVRLAAAGGLGERARRGSLDPGSAAALPLIRSWLPADGTRPLLDTALREARQRGPVGPLDEHGMRRLQLFGTVPDGTGGQSFAAALEGGNGPAAALVLLKTGEGVKDAFLAQGDGIEDVVPSHVAESGGFEVVWPALETVLAAALADGLITGRPPAAGLLDVAGACGLADLRPRPTGVPEWAALADPGGEVAGLSASERSVLVDRSAQWTLDHELVSTWSEGTAVVDEALDEAPGPRQLETALWTRLEERRGYWALLMLRTAHVLRAGNRCGEWQSFAATAAALLDGWPLKKVPIMEHVLSASIAAWQVEEYGLAIGVPDEDAWPGDE